MAKPVLRKPKKKVCAFCKDKGQEIDYKDTGLLRKFISDRGKIRARRVTGNCAQHQRALAMAIKTARELVLLPYTQRTVTERPGGRRSRMGHRGASSPVATSPLPETAPSRTSTSTPQACRVPSSRPGGCSPRPSAMSRRSQGSTC